MSVKVMKEAVAALELAYKDSASYPTVIDDLHKAISEAEKHQPAAWMMKNPFFFFRKPSLHFERPTGWHNSWVAVPLYTEVHE